MRTMCLVFLWLAVPISAQADDYLMVFASEAAPYRPGKAHTFAAVVRVESLPGSPASVVDQCSLSWLPATGNVRPLAMRPETGRNVPLDETIRNGLAAGEQVTMWGPYRITPEFADQFKARVATVESTFQYKAASLLSPLHVCDCVRSVEEMVAPRRYIGIFGYGTAAASTVVQKYTPGIIDPSRTHPWVASLIRLDEYTITRRSHGEYTTNKDQRRAFFRR